MMNSVRGNLRECVVQRKTLTYEYIGELAINCLKYQDAYFKLLANNCSYNSLMIDSVIANIDQTGGDESDKWSLFKGIHKGLHSNADPASRRICGVQYLHLCPTVSVNGNVGTTLAPDDIALRSNKARVMPNIYTLNKKTHKGASWEGE
ncbi:hypothetical protein MHBO_005147 [Bonamia ostreae]|uniref:Uncharacterized protein n=1 Tax=Bonamia ostreae TaxID=126728 RepID=A0ABV2AV65_9EUKA